MIELADTLPEVQVQAAEYTRLLGYPRDRVLDGRSRELADWARDWYRTNGRPWVYARQAECSATDAGIVRLDDHTFMSRQLSRLLVQSEATTAVLVAVSAGPELEAEAMRLWSDGKPDEYFFLEVYGSAVVEHLMTSTGARLCGWAEGRRLAVLPHYSPGYAQWDVAQQPRLLQLIRQSRGTQPLPGALEALETGMLQPRKSQLGVFGLTRHADRVKKLTDLVACESCSFASCQYRRAPYRRSAQSSRSEVAAAAPALNEADAQPVLAADARYVTNVKALRRWADERLTLDYRADGSVVAHFRYEGSTCSNMGRALHFDYHVTLAPRKQGYAIREMRCAPAPGDDGYRYMCRYMSNSEHLMVAIAQDKPLLGKPLNELLAWQRPLMGAGCYCEPASRKHKWGLVLETIHYALVRREAQADVVKDELIPQGT